MPVWTILVPTLGERSELFRRLASVLMPQVRAADGRVQVIGWHNNGSPPLAEIRHRMLSRVETLYTSFVDDDDLVAPDYVPEILRAMRSVPDYVGFQVQCYSDGHPTAVAYHSLEHAGWTNDRKGGRYYRDISHLNPMLTEVARRGDFRRAKPGRPEDRVWAEQIRTGGYLKTEVVIPRIMYHYLYSTSRETGQGSRWEKHRRPVAVAGERVKIDSPYFTWSDDGS